MIRLFVMLLAGGLFISCNSSSTSASNQEEEVVETNEDIVPDGHTSRNSLDWAGNYQGELPCTDCDGIDMEVTINDDNTFAVKTVMQGKDEVIEDSGEIQWASNESYITLKGTTVEYYFRVGENQLTFLVEEGKMPDDTMLTDYTLEKVEQFSVPSSVPPPTPMPE